MLEVKLLSLFVGSLGLQAIAVSRWLRWQQVVVERQYEEEEELLTPYESKDTYASTETQPNGSMTSKDPRLAGWEFKIVRASRDLFREPIVFKRVCEEEAQAGWILLEKLDDHRIRFKRPIALRDIIKSEYLPHDPYRTHYGPTSDWKTLLGAIAFLIAILLPAYLGYVLVANTLSNSRSAPTPTPVPTASGAGQSPAPTNEASPTSPAPSP